MFMLEFGITLITSNMGSNNYDDHNHQKVISIRENVRQLAFDPKTFFEENYSNIYIHIIYTGDDYAWPVYSIAINTRKLENDNKYIDQSTARMVRAPGDSTVTRPRHRGANLINKLAQEPNYSKEVIKLKLDNANLEWLEADLSSCQNAIKVLSEASKAQWIDPNIQNTYLNK